MNASLRLALAVAVVAGGPLVLVGCDGSSGSPGRDGGTVACNVSCPGLLGAATFDLSCGPKDLASISLSGPCATGDASPSNYVDETNTMNLYVSSLSPGVCHVDLTFATGFTYSTDVTFVSLTQTGGCCPGTSVSPTQSTFTVNNPSTTCVDGGTPDAAASDAGADAPSEAAVDAISDSGSCPDGVSCGCVCPSGDDGGICVCENFSMPACLSNASTLGSCSHAGICMGCSEGAGFECFCSDAGFSATDSGGPQWQCIGTEHACTGGTP